MTQMLHGEVDQSASGSRVHGWLWAAMGLAGVLAMSAQASLELNALILPPHGPGAALQTDKGDKPAMHTPRSFLAFAAAAQVLSPIARSMPVRDSRPMVARLPEVLLRTHAGRDVYFCNDLMSDRLAVLNLQYADSANLLLPPARRSPGGVVHAPYLYSLSLQPAIRSAADLRRFMERYGSADAAPFLNGTPEEVTLLRLRLGMYHGT